jgi:hypothetical protein
MGSQYNEKTEHLPVSEYNKEKDTWTTTNTPTIAPLDLTKYKTETDAQKSEREFATKIEEIYREIYKNLPEDIKQNGLPPDYKVSDAQINSFINNAIDHQSEIIDNLKKKSVTIIGTSLYYGGKVAYEVKEIDNNVLFETLKNAFLEVPQLATNEAPERTNEAPAATNEAPAGTNEAPARTNKAQAGTNKAQAGTNKERATPAKGWRGGTIGISKLFIDPRMVPFALLMATDPTLITASITALIMLSCQIKDHLIKNKKIDDTDFFHNLFKDIFKNEESDEIKTDEIKTDEIKTDEIKTDEIKTDEIKTDEIKTDNPSTEQKYKYLYAILIGPCTACENIMPCIINILTKSTDSLKKIFQPNKGGKSRKRKGKKSKKTKKARKQKK